MVKVDLEKLGLNPDDPTIDDICEDLDLEKLSPRCLVEPSELLKEQSSELLKKDVNIELTNPTLARTLSLAKKEVEIGGCLHENDQHFICTFCFKILTDPVECSQC